MANQNARSQFVVDSGQYRWQIGKKVAASLPGFLAGFIAGIIILTPLIVWLLIEILSYKKDLGGCLMRSL